MLLIVLSGRGAAQDRFYMVLFGAQHESPQAEYSHTFATFVRVRPDCAVPDRFCLDSHTISWMPKTLVIRIHALLPETGVALELDTTMEWAFSTGQRVSMWGPYEIKGDLYWQSREQLCALRQGTVRYKALDSGYPTRFASNCIHAVSSCVGGHRPHVTSPSFGETASYYVLQRFHRWIINPKCKHEWLLGALGLNCYPLIHREWENPRTGVFWTSMRSAFGVPAEGRGYVQGGEPNCGTEP